MRPELDPVAHRFLVHVGIRWQFQSYDEMACPGHFYGFNNCLTYIACNASTGRRAVVTPCEIKADRIIRISSKLACATPRFDISVGWR